MIAFGNTYDETITYFKKKFSILLHFSTKSFVFSRIVLDLKLSKPNLIWTFGIYFNATKLILNSPFYLLSLKNSTTCLIYESNFFVVRAVFAKERSTPVEVVTTKIDSMYLWALSALKQRNAHCNTTCRKMNTRLLKILWLNCSNFGLNPNKLKLFCASWKICIVTEFKLNFKVNGKFYNTQFKQLRLQAHFLSTILYRSPILFVVNL